jgi:hypothetical protein
MNVNSRGHDLDTRSKQYFPEIKHPPVLKNPVGAFIFTPRVATQSPRKDPIADLFVNSHGFISFS